MNPQLQFDLEAALADVEDQRALDHVGADAVGRPGGGGRAGREVGVARRPTLAYVRVRMRAVLVAAAEPDEPFALRQSLVDLSAVCTELAATMERPA